VSLITFQFWEQVFGSGKAPKQAYSVLYNCFGNEARGKKMPPNWKVINDTMLKVTRVLRAHFDRVGISEALRIIDAILADSGKSKTK